MADLGEAFNTLKFQKKPFQNIDYFFTQRTMTEEHEYLDKNMNRKNKKEKLEEFINGYYFVEGPTIFHEWLGNSNYE